MNLPFQRISALSRCSIIAAVAIFAPLSGFAVGIMVNEYRVATGGPVTNRMANTEFIEFMLTTDATAADLAALTFGTTTHQTNTLISVFEFDQTTLDNVLTSAGRTTFAAGTMIVVKGTGLGAQNLTYDPNSTNISNADAWSIELVAGQGATDHPENVINGDLDMDRRGTVVWVSTDDPPSNNIDTSGFIAAVGHDDNPGTIADAIIAQFGASNILNTAFGAGARSVVNTGTGGAVTLGSTTTATMGQANDATQQAWIENSLRAAAVPEPSRALLSLVTLLMMTVRRRRRKLD